MTGDRILAVTSLQRCRPDRQSMPLHTHSWLYLGRLRAAVEHAVDLPAGIEPDEVGGRERAHRVVELG